MRALRLLAALTLALALVVSCNDGQPTAPADDAVTVQLQVHEPEPPPADISAVDKDEDYWVCVVPRRVPPTQHGNAPTYMYVDDFSGDEVTCYEVQCEDGEQQLCPGAFQAIRSDVNLCPVHDCPKPEPEPPL